MPYFFLITGIILLVYGGYLLSKENNVKNTGFQELLSKQSNEREEYIRLLTLSQEIKSKLDYADDKLDHILNQLKSINITPADNYRYKSDTGIFNDEKKQAGEEGPPYNNTNKNVKKLSNMEKGEVKYIQKLLKE